MSTSFFAKKNNAKTTLASNLNSGSLSLTVVDGSVFPASGSFMITIWDKTTYPDPSDDPSMEIIKCTSRSSNTLTVVRAQEDTSDLEHSSGVAVEMLFTAAQIVELETAINNRVVLTKIKKGMSVAEATNGVRTLFTLPAAYVEDTLEIYRSGERIFAFTQTDPDAGTFTLTDAPLASESIKADYIEQ